MNSFEQFENKRKHIKKTCQKTYQENMSQKHVKKTNQKNISRKHVKKPNKNIRKNKKQTTEKHFLHFFQTKK